uniref:Cathepsin propeptide inhibitor domain-containing protein n=1 Tax=Canis lupus dingo TaxID=286419 RepID=A0A8C0KTI8_CANLU
MWVAFPLLCAAAGLLGLPACGATDASASSLEKVHFKSWAVQHQKKYSSEEYLQRLQTFVGNWRKINAHNAGNHTFKMGLNQFSDMNFAEIKHKYLWSEPQNCSATKGNYLRGTGPYPPFVDWRKKGKFVSPVKNQVCVAIPRPSPKHSHIHRQNSRKRNSEPQTGKCLPNSVSCRPPAAFLCKAVSSLPPQAALEEGAVPLGWTDVPLYPLPRAPQWPQGSHKVTRSSSSLCPSEMGHRAPFLPPHARPGPAPPAGG